MSRMAFLTLVFARSHDVPPRRSTGGRVAPVYFCTRSSRSTGTKSLSSPAYRSSRNSCTVAAPSDADLLEPDEHADAVIDVDDEVADFEVAQVGEKDRRRGAMPRSGARRSSSKTSASA